MFPKKRTIVFYLLIFLLFSCTKDVHINVPQQVPKLVVNCLFSPDSSWNIFVGKSRPLDDTAGISIVKNASVSLYDETGSHINLSYLDSGYYVSDLKPLIGIKYTIKVSASGFNPVEAVDSIPAQLSVASYKFDTIPTLITPANVFDNVKVNTLNLSIKSPTHKKYCQLQIFAYNKNELYYYIITQSSLDHLKKGYFIKDSTIKKLTKLKGVPILSETRFRKKIDKISGSVFPYLTVVKYAKRKRSSIHFANLFKLEALYSQQPPFYNVTEDYYSVFVEDDQSLSKDNILLYSSYDAFDPSTWGNDPINHGAKKDVEIWLDLSTLSAAAYQFKTTYIKHQLNRENPFAQPVQVYNNIKGGYGIFAGYQKERIRIY